MTKDEMKNRISLALKDPILQQGFEIICKNLAELKKENTELKGIKDVATLIRANNKLVSKSQQLTDARKLIKNIIRVTWGEGWNYSLDWKVKAEQFLKDFEK